MAYDEAPCLLTRPRALLTSERKHRGARGIRKWPGNIASGR